MKIRNFFESLLKYPKWVWGFVLLCAAAPLVFGATAFTLFLACLGAVAALRVYDSSHLADPVDPQCGSACSAVACIRCCQINIRKEDNLWKRTYSL